MKGPIRITKHTQQKTRVQTCNSEQPRSCVQKEGSVTPPRVAEMALMKEAFTGKADRKQVGAGGCVRGHKLVEGV